jgi:hypothetical protein
VPGVELVLRVPGLPPLVAGKQVASDSSSIRAFQRLRECAGLAAADRHGFPLDIGRVGVELTVVSPSPQDFGDAGRCLNAVVWGLVAGSEDVLKAVSGRWLIRDPNQVVQMRFRWEEGADPSYRVHLRQIASAD